MKTKYTMFRRGEMFYMQDSATGKQTSLRTKDEAEANRTNGTQDGIGGTIAKIKLQIVGYPAFRNAVTKMPPCAQVRCERSFFIHSMHL